MEASQVVAAGAFRGAAPALAADTLRAVGAETRVMLANGTSCPVKCLQPGMEVVVGLSSAPGATLETAVVESVRHLLVQRPFLLRRRYRVASPISEEEPHCSFDTYTTGAVELFMQQRGGTKPQQRVKVVDAERKRLDGPGEQMVVFAGGGTYPAALTRRAYLRFLFCYDSIYEDLKSRPAHPRFRLPSKASLVYDLSDGMLGRLLGFDAADGSTGSGALSLSKEDEAHVVPWMARAAVVFGMRVVLYERRTTTVKAMFSTNSGEQVAKGYTLVDASGQPTDEVAYHTERRFSLTAQFRLVMGLTDGITGRDFDRRARELLLTESEEFGWGFLSALVGGDGDRHLQHGRFSYYFRQGRLCGHTGLVLAAAGWAQRLGLGGYLYAPDADTWLVDMRGPAITTLSSYLLQPSKQLPQDFDASRTLPDVHLRAFAVSAVSDTVMCVQVVLAGGPRPVQTAEGLVLVLG